MTKNKQEILKLINDSNDHLTAEEIYFKIKQIIPSISLSTVYRNLGLMVEENLISKYEISDTKTVYDKRNYMHAHIVDENGKIYDIIDDNILKYLSTLVNGKIVSYNLVININSQN